VCPLDTKSKRVSLSASNPCNGPGCVSAFLLPWGGIKPEGPKVSKLLRGSVITLYRFGLSLMFLKMTDSDHQKRQVRRHHCCGELTFVSLVMRSKKCRDIILPGMSPKSDCNFTVIVGKGKLGIVPFPGTVLRGILVQKLSGPPGSYGGTPKACSNRGDCCLIPLKLFQNISSISLPLPPQNARLFRYDLRLFEVQMTTKKSG